MKRKLLKVTAIMLFSGFVCTGDLLAQNVGDFRTKGSGNWGSGSVTGNNLVLGPWEVFDSEAGWIDASSNPGSSSKATIRNEHTISLTATTTIGTLEIENGGILTTDGSVRTLRIVNILDNNGSVGQESSSNRISLMPWPTKPTTITPTPDPEAFDGYTKISGTGKYYVQEFRPRLEAGNLTVEIDANLDIYSYFKGMYSDNDPKQKHHNVVYTINKGKTVNLHAGHFHRNSDNMATTHVVGKYTYNIEGTFDMSHLSNTLNLNEGPEEGNDIIINVNGTWKLPNGFRTVRSGTTAADLKGKVIINIGNEGVIDATARENGTNIVVANGSKVHFFNITGNGVLRQNTSLQSGRTFHVGSNGNYSPVVFNQEVVGVMDINVQDVDALGKKMVRKVWNITPQDGVDLSGITSLKFGTLTVDQTETFSISEPVLVYNWDGSNWNSGTVATVAGEGTLESPRYAEITSVSALGKFSVANETPVTLPLRFISFTATASKLGGQIKLDWITTDEKEVLDFVIERSFDGLSFKEIGGLNAKNISGINYYSAVDNNPHQGTIYYRIKQRDLNGSFSYSKIQFVSFGQVSVSVYPNPVSTILNLAYPLSNSVGEVTLYSLDGKKVLSTKIDQNSSSTQIDISSMSPSIYLLETTINGEVSRQRIQKTN